MLCGFYSIFMFRDRGGHAPNAQNWVAKNPNHFYVGFAATGKQDARILLGSEMDAQKCDQCYEIVLGACRMISPFVRLSLIPLFEHFIHASHFKSELALTIQICVHSIDRRLGQHCLVDSAGQRRGDWSRSGHALHAVHGTRDAGLSAHALAIANTFTLSKFAHMLILHACPSESMYQCVHTFLV